MTDLNKYITQPNDFKELPLEEQLSIVADIKLLCDEASLDTTDPTEQKRWKFRADYWKSTAMNIKKLAELEITNKRMGL